MIIGLTGGSGTGKSTVCSFLKDQGFLVIDADKVYKEICIAHSRCLEEIANAFGRGVLAKDMSLDRKALASIVFSDKSKLEKLNFITHKYVANEIKEIIKKNTEEK